ncbi:unnamed protein product [Haemonchus placei]|uniref:Transposase n=1 Tax=Haemonchus placei TaxID=6290 RepID=A0A0N4WAN1_HAEPC|nr:unnamed protein product [Haemonchus placei]
MCGNIIYSLIKKTAIGADLLKCCAELQGNHARLDLRAVANGDSIRRRSLRLLLHEGCR